MSLLKQALNMNTRMILPIIAVLVTASSLILGNLAVTAYSFLSQSGQSQANTDPGIGKQVLKGVRPSLNGVNIILMGKASGGPDQISIGANMTHPAGTNATNSTSNSNNCNITSGESGANGSPGNGANGGGGGKGGNGGASCAYGSITGDGGIGGNGGNGGIGGSGHNGRNGGSANGGNGDSGGNGGSAFEETT